MDLKMGESAVDIGCGTGEDVRALATRVGPRGRACGVDLSSTMIAIAQQRVGKGQRGVEFIQADVQKLPFEDSSFDAIRAERLLQHTPDADSALREIVRVTKHGGRIVIGEGDLDLFIIDAPDYHASRVMHRLICDSFHNGDIGHQLYRRFLERGLIDVRAIRVVGQFTDLSLIERAFDLRASVERAMAQNLIERNRARAWLESLHSAAVAGRFFSAIGGFIVFGRKY